MGIGMGWEVIEMGGGIWYKIYSPAHT